MTALRGPLLRFVREDLLKGRNVPIDEHTYLFDQGLVDSLGILRLIAFLELQLGRSIDDREVVMEHFRTVHAIESRFGATDATDKRRATDATDATDKRRATGSRRTTDVTDNDEPRTTQTTQRTQTTRTVQHNGGD